MAKNLGIPFSLEKPFYFISYNSEDSERVKKYVSIFQQYNANFWYDKAIKKGKKWEASIDNALKNSKAVIMFVSEGIFKKKDSYVDIEYKTAKGLGKLIYPIFLDKIDMKEIEYGLIFFSKLREIQGYEAYEYKDESACIEALMTDLGICRKEKADSDIAPQEEYEHKNEVKEKEEEKRRIWNEEITIAEKKAKALNHNIPKYYRYYKSTDGKDGMWRYASECVFFPLATIVLIVFSHYLLFTNNDLYKSLFGTSIVFSVLCLIFDLYYEIKRKFFDYGFTILAAIIFSCGLIPILIQMKNGTSSNDIDLKDLWRWGVLLIAFLVSLALWLISLILFTQYQKQEPQTTFPSKNHFGRSFMEMIYSAYDQEEYYCYVLLCALTAFLSIAACTLLFLTINLRIITSSSYIYCIIAGSVVLVSTIVLSIVLFIKHNKLETPVDEFGMICYAIPLVSALIYGCLCFITFNIWKIFFFIILFIATMDYLCLLLALIWKLFETHPHIDKHFFSYSDFIEREEK